MGPRRLSPQKGKSLGVKLLTLLPAQHCLDTCRHRETRVIDRAGKGTSMAFSTDKSLDWCVWLKRTDVLMDVISHGTTVPLV